MNNVFTKGYPVVIYDRRSERSTVAASVILGAFCDDESNKFISDADYDAMAYHYEHEKGLLRDVRDGRFEGKDVFIVDVSLQPHVVGRIASQAVFVHVIDRFSVRILQDKVYENYDNIKIYDDYSGRLTFFLFYIEGVSEGYTENEIEDFTSLFDILDDRYHEQYRMALYFVRSYATDLIVLFREMKELANTYGIVNMVDTYGPAHVRYHNEFLFSVEKTSIIRSINKNNVVIYNGDVRAEDVFNVSDESCAISWIYDGEKLVVECYPHNVTSFSEDVRNHGDYITSKLYGDTFVGFLNMAPETFLNFFEPVNKKVVARKTE